VRFVLLGSTSVRPSLRHAGPAQLLIVDDDLLLFDCGRAVTTRIMEAGFAPTDVRYLFFTHHHFDHNSEFPYFLLVTWVMGRKQPLQICGPEGTQRLHDTLVDQVYREDIRSRLTLPGRSDEGLRAAITEITQEGPVWERGSWYARAVFTDHIPPYIKSLAYRIENQGKSVVIAGDNAPCRSIIELSRNADLLVHECTEVEDELAARGFARWHTGPRQLGVLAQKAGVRKLILKHFTHTIVDDEARLEAMAAAVREHFDGEVIIGRDLLAMDI